MKQRLSFERHMNNLVDDLLQQNRELQQTIYLLWTILATLIALMSYFLYRKGRATNRLLSDANKKLELQSTRDPLTGLLNRQAFHDAMKVRIQKIERRTADLNQPPHALALLDIDHFRLINERFGHAVGDSVLVEVSSRLAQIMRDNDKLMRWSGEEFLIFLNNITTENLDRVVQRVLSVVGGTPILVGNQKLSVTISVGYISLAQGTDRDVDEHWEKSMKLADAALYKAKINGRNRAFGIHHHTIDIAELDAMVTINLDALSQEGKIVVETTSGPTGQEPQVHELM